MKFISYFFMPHTNNLLYVFMVSLFLLGCSGSGGDNKEIQTTITKYNLSISATSDANINSIGDPAPLKINIFNLSSENEFMNSDFFTLHHNSNNVLGRDLLSSKQVYLLPGSEPISVVGQVTEEYPYIGISGEFQNLNNRTWRAIFSIKPIEKIPFYKFWLTSPSQKEINVVIDSQGIYIVEDNDSKK